MAHAQHVTGFVEETPKSEFVECMFRSIDYGWLASGIEKGVVKVGIVYG